MNKILGILGVVAAGAVLIGAGVALRGRLAQNQVDEPLVNCRAIPNPAPHDQEFHFFLDLNPKHKNFANYELQGIEVSDSGLAMESNDEGLRVKGPIPKKDPQLTQSIEVGKNTIKIRPLRDEREQKEQELLLHVGVTLKDKKRNAATITSAICQATIVHEFTKIPPPEPIVPPKPIPPIQVKDKEGNWVEPKKSVPTTPTPAPTPGLKKTASFETKFQKYVTDNMTQLSVVITPQDLAGQTVAGIEISLATQGYTLPPVTKTSFNLNEDGWYKGDWQCSSTGMAVRCLGSQGLQQGKHSVVGLDFNAMIDNPPEFIVAKLLNPEGGTVVGIGIPFVKE